MPYYITMPFNDDRAVVNFTKPDNEPYFKVDELPEGTGILIVEDGKLVRQQLTVLPGIKNPLTVLAEENATLKKQIAEFESQSEFQGNITLDLMAEHEERLCMLELIQ